MMNKENSLKQVRLKILAHMRPFNLISNILGMNPISIKDDEVVPHSRGAVAYQSFLLALVLIELFVGIIYLEVIQGTNEYNIVNLSELFHLFAENIVSCVCLVNAILLTEMASENFNSTIRVHQLMSLLGIEYDYEGQRSMGIRLLLLIYGVILPLLFGSDYYLLFYSNKETYYSFSSWVLTVFHVSFNAYALFYLVLVLQIMKTRFKLLNDAMRDINKISVKNIISEVHFINAENSKMFALPLKDHVRMIKEAHDRLYRICAKV